ncbi:MAG: hypothetical protein FRX49_13010 [Trebouxia sp. A1-2]|nr:MAG: hypothetical protein FRX49_13010 [Trebouxia sp. A1-2]
MHLFAAKVWHRRIAALQIVEVSAGRQYAQRDSVWYVFPDGRCEAATIISIDTTMTPTSYGVSFNATPERTRETVAARLKPVIAVDRSDLDCEGYPCPAASCQSTVAASILQELAKEAFDDFCMAANEASLHAMGITGCPNCGTYVERLPPASPLSGVSGPRVPEQAITELLQAAGLRPLGYPGPAISFNFLSCPSCGDGGGHRHGNLQISSSAPPMQHPALMESLKRPLELREQTVQRAKQRLKMEGLHLDAALKPGQPEK